MLWQPKQEKWVRFPAGVFKKRCFHWGIAILKWVRLVIFIFFQWNLGTGECVGIAGTPLRAG